MPTKLKTNYDKWFSKSRGRSSAATRVGDRLAFTNMLKGKYYKQFGGRFLTMLQLFTWLAIDLALGNKDTYGRTHALVEIFDPANFNFFVDLDMKGCQITEEKLDRIIRVMLRVFVQCCGGDPDNPNDLSSIQIVVCTTLDEDYNAKPFEEEYEACPICTDSSSSSRIIEDDETPGGIKCRKCATKWSMNLETGDMYIRYIANRHHPRMEELGNNPVPQLKRSHKTGAHIRFINARCSLDNAMDLAVAMQQTLMKEFSEYSPEQWMDFIDTVVYRPTETETGNSLRVLFCDKGETCRVCRGSGKNVMADADEDCCKCYGSGCNIVAKHYGIWDVYYLCKTKGKELWENDTLVQLAEAHMTAAEEEINYGVHQAPPCSPSDEDEDKGSDGGGSKEATASSSSDGVARKVSRTTTAGHVDRSGEVDDQEDGRLSRLEEIVAPAVQRSALEIDTTPFNPQIGQVAKTPADLWGLVKMPNGKTRRSTAIEELNRCRPRVQQQYLYCLMLASLSHENPIWRRRIRVQFPENMPMDQYDYDGSRPVRARELQALRNRLGMDPSRVTRNQANQVHIIRSSDRVSPLLHDTLLDIISGVDNRYILSTVDKALWKGTDHKTIIVFLDGVNSNWCIKMQRFHRSSRAYAIISSHYGVTIRCTCKKKEYPCPSWVGTPSRQIDPEYRRALFNVSEEGSAPRHLGSIVRRHGYLMRRFGHPNKINLLRNFIVGIRRKVDILNNLKNCRLTASCKIYTMEKMLETFGKTLESFEADMDYWGTRVKKPRVIADAGIGRFHYSDSSIDKTLHKCTRQHLPFRPRPRRLLAFMRPSQIPSTREATEGFVELPAAHSLGTLSASSEQAGQSGQQAQSQGAPEEGELVDDL